MALVISFGNSFLRIQFFPKELIAKSNLAMKLCILFLLSIHLAIKVKAEEANEVCESNHECQGSLVCRRKHKKVVCLEPGSKGDFCDTDSDCGTSLYCRTEYQNDLVRKCLPKGLEGELCEHKDQCHANSSCIYFDSKERKSCTSMKREGEVCSYYRDFESGCHVGTCASIDSESNSITGIRTCLKPGEEGEVCNDSRSCKRQLRCSGLTTEPKRVCSQKRTKIGAYCSQYTECDSEATTCRKKAQVGFSTCEKFAKRGELCEKDFHCGNGLGCVLKKNVQGDWQHECNYLNGKREACDLKKNYLTYNCPAGLTCRIPGPGKCGSVHYGYCLDKLKNGELACSDNDCESGTVWKSPNINKGKVCSEKPKNLPLMSPCREDSYCTGKFICRWESIDSSHRRCLPKAETGNFCSNDHDCKSGICDTFGMRICSKKPLT